MQENGLNKFSSFVGNPVLSQRLSQVTTSQSLSDPKDNIYIDMQAGRNLLPKLLVADN